MHENTTTEPAEYVGKHRSAETQSWSAPIHRARHLADFSLAVR